MLTIKDSICLGCANGEDSCGWGENFAFVIDGASGLTGVHVTDSKTDARWLAESLAAFLQETLGDPEREMTEIFLAAAECLKRAYDAFWQQAGRADLPEYPSASVAAVRIRGGQAEYFGLGDCTVVVESPAGKREVIAEEKLSALDKQVIDHMMQLSRQTGCSVLEARKRLNHELVANRKLCNRPEGYWIFEPMGSGVPHGRTAQWAAEQVQTITLMSDGFAQLVSPFGVAGDYEALHDMAHECGVLPLVQKLQALQQADGDCSAYPRFKLSDDTTVLIAELTADN